MIASTLSSQLLLTLGMVTTSDVVVVIAKSDESLMLIVGLLGGIVWVGMFVVFGVLRFRSVRRGLEKNGILKQYDFGGPVPVISFLTAVQALQLPASKVS